jgi:uncharacterized protein YbjT (DUF2867 family)
MKREVLVTAGNGMFGHGLIATLLGDERVKVRAMVRDRDKFKLKAPNLEVVVADMDAPETLAPAVAGVTHVFLTAPMDAHIAAREIAVMKAVHEAGGAHILKLFGAVRHEGDALKAEHGASLDYLQASGLPWTLISPSSVMETSLLAYAELLKFDCVMGMSGEGKVGLVAAEDVALATRAVVLSDGHEGQNYELTGPAALSLYGVCNVFSQVLGRRIHYYDMPEDEFAAMMLEHGDMTAEELEIGVLCHLRAWRDGKADLVTDTYTKLTGEPPTSLDDWIGDHIDSFEAKPSFGDRIAAFFMHQKYARHHDDGEAHKE